MKKNNNRHPLPGLTHLTVTVNKNTWFVNVYNDTNVVFKNVKPSLALVL